MKAVRSFTSGVLALALILPPLAWALRSGLEERVEAELSSTLREAASTGLEEKGTAAQDPQPMRKMAVATEVVESLMTGILAEEDYLTNHEEYRDDTTLKLPVSEVNRLLKKRFGESFAMNTSRSFLKQARDTLTNSFVKGSTHSESLRRRRTLAAELRKLGVEKIEIVKDRSAPGAAKLSPHQDSFDHTQEAVKQIARERFLRDHPSQAKRLPEKATDLLLIAGGAAGASSPRTHIWLYCVPKNLCDSVEQLVRQERSSLGKYFLFRVMELPPTVEEITLQPAVILWDYRKEPHPPQRTRGLPLILYSADADQRFPRRLSDLVAIALSKNRESRFLSIWEFEKNGRSFLAVAVET